MVNVEPAIVVRRRWSPEEKQAAFVLAFLLLAGFAELAALSSLAPPPEDGPLGARRGATGAFARSQRLRDAPRSLETAPVVPLPRPAEWGPREER